MLQISVIDTKKYSIILYLSDKIKNLTILFLFAQKYSAFNKILYSDKVSIQRYFTMIKFS